MSDIITINDDGTVVGNPFVEFLNEYRKIGKGVVTADTYKTDGDTMLEMLESNDFDFPTGVIMIKVEDAESYADSEFDKAWHGMGWQGGHFISEPVDGSNSKPVNVMSRDQIEFLLTFGFDGGFGLFAGAFITAEDKNCIYVSSEYDGSDGIDVTGKNLSYYIRAIELPKLNSMVTTVKN